MDRVPSITIGLEGNISFHLKIFHLKVNTEPEEDHHIAIHEIAEKLNATIKNYLHLLVSFIWVAYELKYTRNQYFRYSSQGQ